MCCDTSSLSEATLPASTTWGSGSRDLRHIFAFTPGRPLLSLNITSEQSLIMSAGCAKGPGSVSIGLPAVAPGGARLFPFSSVERDDRHRLDRVAVDAASIDADAVGVRARDVKR